MNSRFEEPKLRREEHDSDAEGRQEQFEMS